MEPLFLDLCFLIDTVKNKAIYFAQFLKNYLDNLSQNFLLLSGEISEGSYLDHVSERSFQNR